MEIIPENKSIGIDTITVIFEQGFTDAEKLIIDLEKCKGKRLGLNFNKYYSHCSIMIDSMIYDTHPKHGVICNKFAPNDRNREFIEISVDNKQEIKNKLDYLDDTENVYYYEGVVFQGIYMQIGIWLGNKEPHKFYCSKLVSYVLGYPNYYKMDILDVYVKVKK